jgi:asparagine synthase (glutamine-hydrolysing)
MCGILGLIDREKKISKNKIRESTDTMILRGPDAGGIIFFEKEKYNVGLGHRRLAILDLDPRSNQPYEDNNHIIVFNGEIYNFNTIKQQLEDCGHTFKTRSDTEVIIKAYQQWGDACFEKLIGMFAICIYDIENNEILLVRDRVGVKPLYFLKDEKRIAFSSESRAINSLFNNELEISKSALLGYFSLGYVPAEESIFSGVKKLKPGTITKINLDTYSTITKEFWNIKDHLNNNKLEKKNTHQLEELIIDSIKLRQVSDVKLGSFLSGGLDSSYVTKVMQDNIKPTTLNSFTVGFKEHFDEAPHAKKVADYIGTLHHTYYIKPDDVKSIIENYPLYFDEPYSDDAAIPMIYLSEMSKESVKAVISSDGGDELFAGYSRYKNTLKYNSLLSKVPYPLLYLVKASASIIEPLIPFKGKNKNFLWRLKNIINADKNIQLSNILYYGDRIPDPVLKKVITKELMNSEIHHNYYFDSPIKISPLKHILCADFKERLVNQMLVKVDKSTMAASIEGREPLLDHRLFEFMFSKNDDAFIKSGVQKSLFREIIHRKFNDKEILNKPKLGFNTPINKWLKEDYSEFVEIQFKSIKDLKIPYLKGDNVLRFWDDYKKGKIHYQNLLWRILIYVLWYKNKISKIK